MLCIYRPADVWREDDVTLRAKRVIKGGRLLFRDIESFAQDPAFLQRGNECRLVHDTAP